MKSKLVNIIDLDKISYNPDEYSFLKFALIYTDLQAQLKFDTPQVVSVSSLINCIVVASDDIRPHLIALKDIIFSRFSEIENILISPVKKTIRKLPDKSKITVEVRHLTDKNKEMYDKITSLVRIDREMLMTEAKEEFRI